MLPEATEAPDPPDEPPGIRSVSHGLRVVGVEMFVDFDQFVYARGEAELATRTLGLDLRTAPFVPNTTGSKTSALRTRSILSELVVPGR